MKFRIQQNACSYKKYSGLCDSQSVVKFAYIALFYYHCFVYYILVLADSCVKICQMLTTTECNIIIPYSYTE